MPQIGGLGRVVIVSLVLAMSSVLTSFASGCLHGPTVLPLKFDILPSIMRLLPSAIIPTYTARV
jgi:hypothetical protein